MGEVKQAVFDRDEIRAIRDGLALSRKDEEILRQWKREKIMCPHCLYMGTLHDFKTFITGGKRRAKNKLSTRMAMCPDCGKKMRIDTLRMVAKYSMWEFANYFWETFYLYQGYLIKSMPKVKRRLYHFSYKNRQTFWNVWKEWKKVHSDGHSVIFWRKEDLERIERQNRQADEYEKEMKEAFRKK